MLIGAVFPASGSQLPIKDGGDCPVENGKPAAIHSGRRCADLWAAPDGSAIAFIGIDEVRPDRVGSLPGEPAEFLIERSSVYVARRSGRFDPRRVTQ